MFNQLVKRSYKLKREFNMEAKKILLFFIEVYFDLCKKKNSITFNKIL